MNKKICIVTGATSGIGFEAAKSLAQKGFFVVLACRNKLKAEDCRIAIKEKTKNQNVFCIDLDLSSFASIESFAKEFMKKFDRLDVLINNAGTICDRHHKTEQGFEMTIGVNYIGHYYLTELLLPIIKKTPKSRILNVSSIVGIKSKMNDEILDFYAIRHGMCAYTASKLAQIFYTIDLSERLEDCDVTVNALHPGVIGTNIWSGEGSFMKITNPIMKFVFPSPSNGAKNLVYLAVSPEVENITGAVFSKRKKIALGGNLLNTDLKKKLISKTNNAIQEVKTCKKNIVI